MKKIRYFEINSKIIKKEFEKFSNSNDYSKRFIKFVFYNYILIFAALLDDLLICKDVFIK